jgi:hypothetical protein
MVSRQLVYYTYGSINAKPPFEYPQALTELRDKIAVDPNFAVVEQRRHHGSHGHVTGVEDCTSPAATTRAP